MPSLEALVAVLLMLTTRNDGEILPSWQVLNLPPAGTLSWNVAVCTCIDLVGRKPTPGPLTAAGGKRAPAGGGPDIAAPAWVHLRMLG
jgi:hypothetical protein